MKKFKEIVYSIYIYQNLLNKGCFQRDMAYGDFKELSKRAAPEKNIG